MEWLQKQDFVEIHSPKLLSTASESHLMSLRFMDEGPKGRQYYLLA